MASVDPLDEDSMQTEDGSVSRDEPAPGKLFTLKKWNAVAMWSWDVDCDVCAICRVQV